MTNHPNDATGSAARRQHEPTGSFHRRYSEDELMDAAFALMERLETEGIATSTAGVDAERTAGVVTVYDRPAGVRSRAEVVASELADEISVPVRVAVTDVPNARSRTVPAALHYFTDERHGTRRKP